MTKKSAVYPADFLWGASTAAHQVEGGNHNQWSVWETTNAQRLAAKAPNTLAWLPGFETLRPQLTDPANYLSGNGVEHYQRYQEDFDILGKLGMNSFRFSIEWSRIEPQPGVWDEAAIEHYRGYISALQARGIEPVLTLWHWTVPVWFAETGGFERRANLHHFERYVQKIAQEFGTTLRYVLTLNEPNVYASFSYMLGQWPPAYKRPLLGLRVYQNLVVAHRTAYRVLKRANPNLQVGLAAQLGDCRPTNPHNPVNQLVVAAVNYGWNWWFLNRVRRQLDVIGVNYYFSEYRDWRGRVRNPDGPLSDLGWYMEPSGIGRLLQTIWRRYHKPLLIVENGLADAADTRRKWWLEQTLGAVDDCMARDIPIIGYLHWSLLDNFEWAYGWWPKFGLVAVDRTTMQRTIRPSARWLSAEIRRRQR